jgi:hypothetical protein
VRKIVSFAGMKETELWELLVSLSANEISLQEAHDRILRLVNDLEPIEQFICGCGNPNLTWYGYGGDKTYFCFECKKEVTK